jgi:hypothetical protein
LGFHQSPQIFDLEVVGKRLLEHVWYGPSGAVGPLNVIGRAVGKEDEEKYLPEMQPIVITKYIEAKILVTCNKKRKSHS